MKKTNPWIEAMRLRTLPVSLAGVVGGCSCALYHHGFAWGPALICFAFAALAQIIANFANEYYDFKNGIDRKGREGFRRGVTEGDIKPASMKKAIFFLLAIDMALGCSLIIWGGWWLIWIGIAVGIFALAYSTGPYPLSYHGLGDIAVLIFFGLIPVIFSEYVQTRVLELDYITWFVSFAIGLIAVNVLIVNNYRDFYDDKAVGKKTTVVILGRKTMSAIYFADGIMAAILLAMATSPMPFWVSAGWLTYFMFHSILWTGLKSREGKSLNGILKWTSLLLLFTAVYLLIICAVFPEGYNAGNNLPFFLNY